MRIFRRQESKQPAARPQVKCTPKPPALGARYVPYSRLNWRTAREAIAHSRAVLERTKYPPAVEPECAKRGLQSVEGVDPKFERLLTLRQSCESACRVSQRARLRANRAFEHSSALICEAENLRRRVRKMKIRLTAKDHATLGS